MGAMNVALCFSAANIKTVKTNIEVRKASRKRPIGLFIPVASFVIVLVIGLICAFEFKSPNSKKRTEHTRG